MITVVTLLWDMRKYFENISLEVLFARAVSLGVPVPLVRLCVNTYRSLRVVRACDRYYVVSFNTCGIDSSFSGHRHCAVNKCSGRWL